MCRMSDAEVKTEMEHVLLSGWFVQPPIRTKEGGEVGYSATCSHNAAILTTPSSPG